MAVNKQHGGSVLSVQAAQVLSGAHPGIVRKVWQSPATQIGVEDCLHTMRGCLTEQNKSTWWMQVVHRVFQTHPPGPVQKMFAELCSRQMLAGPGWLMLSVSSLCG